MSPQHKPRRFSPLAKLPRRDRSASSPHDLLQVLESRLLLSGGAPTSFTTGDDFFLLQTAGSVGNGPPNATFVQASSPSVYVAEEILSGNSAGGTYNYTRNNATTATITHHESDGSGTLVLTFSSASVNSGTYSENNSDGSFDSGIFVMDTTPIPALAPASISGDDFLLSIATGGGTLATSGSYHFTPAALGSAYSVQPVSGSTASDTGFYTYSQPSNTTSSEIQSTDASSFSSDIFLVFTSTTTGVFLNTDEGLGTGLSDYQVGTFNVGIGTTTAVTSTLSTSGSGQTVTFSATVTPDASSTNTPSGSVTFYDGTTSLGTGTLTNGVANLNVSWLTAGTHAITATYAGDANFGPGTGASFSATVTLDPSSFNADTLVVNITAGTGVFASSGSDTLAFDPSGNTYSRSGADGTATGTFTYTPTSDTSATITIVDSSGLSGTITLSFTGALAGAIHIDGAVSASPNVAHAFAPFDGTSSGTLDGSFALNAPIPEFRLYLGQTAEHLYTTDANEYAVLSTRGWVQEGAPYEIFSSQVTLGGVTAEPYYRLYNPGILQHLWTTDANEYSILANRGWNQEGIIGYIFATAAAGSSPLYRLNLNTPSNDLHLWTTDLNEYTVLASNDGWTQEGIIGYVLTQSPG